MKKGFTLLELLAVIVVLAIIALIITPFVTNAIKEAKKGTFKNSVYGIEEAANLHYGAKLIKEDFSDTIINLVDGVDENNPNFKYKGASVKSAYIEINSEGKIRMYMWNDGFCAKKELNEELTITETEEADCSLNTLKAPVLSGGSNEWRQTATITILSQPESVKTLDYYEYFLSNQTSSLTNGTWERLRGEIELNTNGEYYVYVRGVDTEGIHGDVSSPAIVKIDTTDYNIVIPEVTGGSIISDKATAKVGETVTLTITPNENYILATYTLNGEKSDANSFVMPNTNITISGVFYKSNYDYTGNYEIFTVPISGNYQIELWGAQGGSYFSNFAGGNGGYTSGIISLEKDEELYIYVGGEGQLITTPSTYLNGGFNGGGPSETEDLAGSYSSTGGGATDVRYAYNTLNDRIMVAGGGGGTNSRQELTYIGYGGASGGLFGSKGTTNQSGGIVGSGGSQTKYGENRLVSGQNGAFGLGGGGSKASNAGSGGGGYYGGAAGERYRSGGGGGSSFISGHTGCVAIASADLEDDIRTTRLDSNNKLCGTSASTGYNALGYNTNSKCSEHYSGKKFRETLMIDGSGKKWEVIGTTLHNTESVRMNKPEGGQYDANSGHTGDGYAKITYIP